MAYTYDQLKGMTVAQLREIAAGIEHEAVKGHTQLNKEHLLTALCTALSIDTHTRHKSKVAGLAKRDDVVVGRFISDVEHGFVQPPLGAQMRHKSGKELRQEFLAGQ